jgi:hypothetical protein
LPGLPMFGHGQIEGFEERYGMEYRRAYKNEQADGWLVGRHEREIFPLLAKRHLFSGVESFLLYDFVTPSGAVDEDVFAYSNQKDGERTFVVVHNKWKETRGVVKTSVSFADGNGIAQRSVADGLSLRDGPKAFTVLRDHISGLEYLQKNESIVRDGLAFDLGAFHYRVFTNIREVTESAEAPWGELAASLGTRGVPSVEDALADLHFKAIHDSFFEAVAPGSASYLAAGYRDEVKQDGRAAAAVIEKLGHLSDGLAYLDKKRGREVAEETLWSEARSRVVSERLAKALRAVPPAKSKSPALAALGVDPDLLLVAVAFTEAAAEMGGEADVVNAWRLDRVLARAFENAGLEAYAARAAAELVALAPSDEEESLTAGLARTFTTERGKVYLGVNEHNGVRWFNKERYESLAAALCLARGEPEAFAALAEEARTAGYQVDVLLADHSSPGSSAPPDGGLEPEPRASRSEMKVPSLSKDL